MGGGLLQKVNRDTQKFAFKVSEATINGQRVPVRKEPASDPGKWSKAGRLDLIFNDTGEYQTVVVPDSLESHPRSVLHTVYENGRLLNETTLDEVRRRATAY